MICARLVSFRCVYLVQKRTREQSEMMIISRTVLTGEIRARLRQQWCCLSLLCDQSTTGVALCLTRPVFSVSIGQIPDYANPPRARTRR